MNANRLINMAMRMLMRKGISKGIDIAANRGKSAKDMTPEQRASAQETRQTAHKARRGLNLVRRLMR
ncbi:MAG: hypothetical protein AAFQ09_01415 [Pseudomonadota bacterium]